MFYFRINKLTIADNFDNPSFLDPFNIFGTDTAEVKLHSFVTTDDMGLPDVDEACRVTDEAQKKALIAAAVQKVVAARVLTTIPNVTDDHIMTFGDTGYVLYQSETIPTDFSWCFLATESDRDVRRIGESLEQIVGDEKYDSFLANILTLASTAANPGYAAALAITKFITKVAAAEIKRNEDDVIGILYMSLNRQQHYHHGIRNSEDVPDLTNNVRIDYSIFAYED